MKHILIIIASVALVSCNENNNASSTAKAAADTSAINNDSTQLLNQNVKASMVGTSDSLMPGKTTEESWKIAGFNNPAAFKEFFKQFKTWVADDNRDSIAAHIRFPIRNCPSAAAFKDQYSTFFNAEVKKAVLTQDPEKFFANYNGAMAGDGDLWFSEIDGNYYVITINNKM